LPAGADEAVVKRLLEGRFGAGARAGLSSDVSTGGGEGERDQSAKNPSEDEDGGHGEEFPGIAGNLRLWSGGSNDSSRLRCSIAVEWVSAPDAKPGSVVIRRNALLAIPRHRFVLRRIISSLHRAVMFLSDNKPVLPIVSAAGQGLAVLHDNAK
jgi:hypothetical protein